MTDTVDKIVIQAETQGIDQATSDVQGLSKAMDGVTVASASVEKSTGSVDSKFASLERRFGTVAGQAAQLAKVQQTVNAAVAANPALQDRADAVWASATERYGAAIVAEKALGDAHAGLSAQGQAALHSVRSMVEQLALGIPPTQALTGQMNHLTFAATGEGGLKGAFGEVAGLASSILTPMRLVAGGVLGVAAAALYVGNNWQESAGQVDRALTGIGARTGTTAKDINNFAKANSTATGLSITDARNAAIEFTKTGNIQVASLKGVGEAIHGYSTLTGKDATEATKAFADALGVGAFATADLIKGMEGIDKAYGVLDPATKDYIRTLDLAGERTQALQVFFDKIVPASKAAGDSVGYLSNAWKGFKNVVSNVVNGVPSPTSDQDRLSQLQQQRADAASTPSLVGSNPGGYGLLNTGSLAGGKSQELADLDKQIDALQKKIDAFDAKTATAQLTELSNAAKGVVSSIIPEIDKIDKLKSGLAALNAAQAKGVNLPGMDAAKTAIQDSIDKLNDAKDGSARYNQRVKEISKSWGDVGQSTALALEKAQNQLPVFEAVGGAAKMVAQYTADYANYINQGYDKTEATALAASNLAAAQAQVNSNAQQMLASLQDQSAISAARTPIEAAHAQAQATLNDLLRQGVDAQTAMNVAAQEESNAREKIYVQAQKMVQASQDQLALANAQGTEYEAATKAGIAYRNAIEAGATQTQAGAIYANTLALAMQQADVASQKYAENMENAARAAHDAQFADITPGGDNSFGFFQLKSGIEGNTVSTVPYWMQRALQDASVAPPNATAIANKILAGGNVDSAISAIQGLNAGTTTSNVGASLEAALHMQPGQLGLTKSTTITQSDIISLVGQLYTAKNASTSDKSQQAANLQQELAWLQNQPQSLDTINAIASLKSSIDSLTGSTNSLNSTNQDLLSPYYSQDPRTSHIGFRSQGMATGGELTVPGGYSANDNMLAQIPVASGEIVSVRRPGQNLGGSSTSVTINLGGITVNNSGTGKVDTNAIGRTVYQAMQTSAKQLAAASR